MYSVMIISINIVESKKSERDIRYIPVYNSLLSSSLKQGTCDIHVTYTCCQ